MRDNIWTTDLWWQKKTEEVAVFADSNDRTFTDSGLNLLCENYTLNSFYRQGICRQDYLRSSNKRRGGLLRQLFRYPPCVRCAFIFVVSLTRMFSIHCCLRGCLRDITDCTADPNDLWEFLGRERDTLERVTVCYLRLRFLCSDRLFLN